MAISWLKSISQLGQAGDEALMERLQIHADGQALNELMVRWEKPVNRLCRRLLGDGHLAEDLTQETFLRVYQHRMKFRHEARFGTFVRRIALNACLDFRRRKRLRPEISVNDLSRANDEKSVRTDHFADNTALPGDAILANREQAEQVRWALAQLPESMQTVVVLRHYEKLKFREIAEIVEMPEGTVKTNVFRALRQLRTLLETPGHAQKPIRNVTNDEVLT